MKPKGESKGKGASAPEGAAREIDHSKREHAEFSPSALHLYAASPCYRPSPDSNLAAERGTLCHEALEDSAAAWDALTEEERACVKAAIRYTAPYLDGEVSRERTVRVGDITWGTVDLLSRLGDHLHVVDFKFGDVPVYARGNWQLMTYALGALAEFAGEIERVFLHIVQTPINNISVAECDPAELQGPFRDRLAETVAAARFHRSAGKTKPSLSACRYCALRSECPEVVEAAGDLAELAGESLQRPGPVPPTGPTPEQIAIMLAWRDVLTRPGGWADRIREIAIEYWRAGVPIPGVRLQEIAGRTEVANPVAAFQVWKRLGLPVKDYVAGCRPSLTKLNDPKWRKALEAEKLLLTSAPSVRVTLDHRPALVNLPSPQQVAAENLTSARLANRLGLTPATGKTAKSKKAKKQQ